MLCASVLAGVCTQADSSPSQYVAAGSDRIQAEVVAVLRRMQATLTKLEQMIVAEKTRLTVCPSSANSDVAVQLTMRLDIELKRAVTLPACCQLSVPQGKLPVACTDTSITDGGWAWTVRTVWHK